MKIKKKKKRKKKKWNTAAPRQEQERRKTHILRCAEINVNTDSHPRFKILDIIHLPRDTLLHQQTKRAQNGD